jgi:hypothetical protein
MKLIMKSIHLYISRSVIPVKPIILYQMCWYIIDHNGHSVRLDHKGFSINDYRKIIKQL